MYRWFEMSIITSVIPFVYSHCNWYSKEQSTIYFILFLFYLLRYVLVLFDLLRYVLVWMLLLSVFYLLRYVLVLFYLLRYVLVWMLLLSE